MKYKKEHIKPNGRKLIRGGPRDLQNRQKQQLSNVVDPTDLIKELKGEIDKLSEELRERPVVNGYSGEQMDDEIRTAVTDAVKDLKEDMVQSNDKEQKLAVELTEKEKELEKIKNAHNEEIRKLLTEHSEKLERLTATVMGGTAVQHPDNDRPQLEDVFIDPLEDDAGKDLKPFLEEKIISVDEKDNMFDKVDKLRGMLGKGLPTKK